MLGNYTKKTYIHISKEGKIVHKDETGRINEYAYVDGILTRIAKRERMYENNKILSIDIDLRDGDAIYCLNVNLASGMTRGLLNSLCNIEDFAHKMVRISAYLNKNGFLNSSVSLDGQNIKWKYPIEEVPKVEKFVRGSKEFSDDSKCIAWTEERIQEIQSRLVGQAEDWSDHYEGDDLPEAEGEDVFE